MRFRCQFCGEEFEDKAMEGAKVSHEMCIRKDALKSRLSHNALLTRLGDMVDDLELEYFEEFEYDDIRYDLYRGKETVGSYPDLYELFLAVEDATLGIKKF